MDDLDKDVAGLLGIDPQVLEAQSVDPAPAPRRRTPRGATLSVAAALSIAALFVLTMTTMRPAPATPPPAPSSKPAVQPEAHMRKLDMFVDRQTPDQALERGVADDGAAEPADAGARGETQAWTAQATGRARRMGPARKERRSLDEPLHVARADRAETRTRPASRATVDTVDLPGDTRTALQDEAQRTLVEDRLEAIDAIRLLRQR